MLPLRDWIIAAACLTVLIGLLIWSARARQSRRKRLPAEWALTSRSVFSIEERRFYRHLCAALPEHIVLAKLPLVRFCQPTDANQVRYWYDMLGVIHVSFAICSGSGRVLAAVDVEGERGSSRRTLQVKESVLAACGVRYLRCPPDAPPSAQALQQLVPAMTVSRTAVPSPVAETRNKLSRIVATRRQERASRWQDSTQSAPDSTFSGDSLLDAPGDLGGAVADASTSSLRH